jgi:hypothetical protein
MDHLVTLAKRSGLCVNAAEYNSAKRRLIMQSTYTIDRFIIDVRQVFANLRDPKAQAQAVANHMKDLLEMPDLLEEIKLRSGGKLGRVDLHIDKEYGHPAPGFCLMTSLPSSRTERMGGHLPHDHGASFVVYGVYKGAIDQTKYKWTYTKDGDWTSPELRASEQFVQRAGDIAFFLPGEIHKTTSVGSEPPVVIRLEAQWLNRVLRHACNPEKNTVALQQ